MKESGFIIFLFPWSHHMLTFQLEQRPRAELFSSWWLFLSHKIKITFLKIVNTINGNCFLKSGKAENYL